METANAAAQPVSKNSHFRAGKAAAVGQELHDLDEAGSRHGGDGQEERELGRHRA